jgi:hypothetical protein
MDSFHGSTFLFKGDKGLRLLWLHIVHKLFFVKGLNKRYFTVDDYRKSRFFPYFCRKYTGCLSSIHGPSGRGKKGALLLTQRDGIVLKG